MIDIIDAVGISLVGTRSEGTDAPSADTVGSSREIEFFERQTLGVAVRYGHTDSGMEDQGIALVDHEILRIVEIEFHVLGKVDIGQLIDAVITLFPLSQSGDSVHQVSGFFNVQTDGVRVSLGRLHRTGSGTVIRIGIAQAHDEQVFVAVSQQRIHFVHPVQILLERRRGIGHVDVVDVQQVEPVCSLSPPCPVIAPGCRCQGTLKLRTDLPVVLHTDL